jgi:hypothetical protein
VLDIDVLDEGEQRLRAAIPHAEDEARKADRRMIREQLI